MRSASDSPGSQDDGDGVDAPSCLRDRCLGSADYDVDGGSEVGHDNDSVSKASVGVASTAIQAIVPRDGAVPKTGPTTDQTKTRRRRARVATTWRKPGLRLSPIASGRRRGLGRQPPRRRWRWRWGRADDFRRRVLVAKLRPPPGGDSAARSRIPPRQLRRPATRIRLPYNACRGGGGGTAGGIDQRQNNNNIDGAAVHVC